MLNPLSSTVARLSRPVTEYLEAAADARRRGDLAAADAAEMAAANYLRALLSTAEGGR